MFSSDIISPAESRDATDMFRTSEISRNCHMLFPNFLETRARYGTAYALKKSLRDLSSMFATYVSQINYKYQRQLDIPASLR